MSEPRPPGTHGTGKAPAPGYAHAHEAPYEPPHESVEFDREIQYHQLIWMGVGLLVIALLSGVGVFFLLRGFVSWRAEAAAGSAPLVAPAPPAEGAKLLARPERELDRVRREEKERLETYGWVDQTAGVAHIPVERAIEIVAQRGLPTRAAAPTPAPAATATVPPVGTAPVDAAAAVAATPAPSPAPAASPEAHR
ncbi:MAG TPA: hypothetical protein VN811_10480 [Thermoanaerobaculia bacterium]|nr:hypothetical protein [Thermoanaerobaculia bacterium]